MFCSACGRQVAEGASVCECGAPMQEARLVAAAGAGSTATTVPSPTLPSQTKACPYCGEQILNAAIRCKHCQSSLVPSQPHLPQPQGISVQGPQIPGTQPTIVIQNVQAQQGTPQQVGYREIKNPTVAAVLSFVFPGGGQFYNGHAGKGIIVLLTFWLIIPYIWSILDAYNSANRINRTGV